MAVRGCIRHTKTGTGLTALSHHAQPAGSPSMVPHNELPLRAVIFFVETYRLAKIFLSD